MGATSSGSVEAAAATAAVADTLPDIQLEEGIDVNYIPQVVAKQKLRHQFVNMISELPQWASLLAAMPLVPNRASQRATAR
jgi:hypothetical protein